jgi:hypothetical protein
MVNKPSRTKEVATGSGVIFFFQGTTILRKLCVEGTPWKVAWLDQQDAKFLRTISFNEKKNMTLVRLRTRWNKGRPKSRVV